MPVPGDRSWWPVALAVFLILVMFAAPPVAMAQQARAVHRVGLLGPGGPSGNIEEFRRGLVELGYVEGRNIHIEARWAENNVDRLPALAAELVQARVDVIVAFISTAAKAAQQATATIPIVMVSVGDPLSLGLIASLARPGANITGTTSFGPELDSKRMQLLKEVIPGLKNAVILWNPTNPLHEPSLERSEAAARAFGVEIQTFKATTLDEIESAIQAIPGHVGALIVYADGALLSRSGARISALALDRRKATIFLHRADIQAGGLISYSPNMALVFKRGATYVDRILKGMKPADLPVEEPTTFQLAINLKTAKALGLTIPPSVLLRADHVIE